MSDPHPETRQDPITQQWVIQAPSRSERPQRTGAPTPDHDPRDDTPVEGCPFCPGHEAMLPAIHAQRDADDRPWHTRAVPNKYPALTPDAPDARTAPPFYRSRPNTGHQEVLIDTPYHHQDLPQMSVDEVDAVLQTYLARYRAVREADSDRLPILFRNHGARAGASIDHPHSQLIAPTFVPPRLRQEEAAAQTQYQEDGTCPYCTMIAVEQDVESRMVWSDEHAVCFVPYAARVPYELWILPRRHEPEVTHTTDAERRSVATALQTACHRLYTHLGDPDYNFFVRTAIAYQSEAPYLHWSLRIRPRTTVEAGFERATGLHINPSSPERDAAVLREDG
jgi:UDPglucose--hexose-1-phosphate uridylyltransferase